MPITPIGGGTDKELVAFMNFVNTALTSVEPLTCGQSPCDAPPPRQNSCRLHRTTQGRQGAVHAVGLVRASNAEHLAYLSRKPGLIQTRRFRNVKNCQSRYATSRGVSNVTVVRPPPPRPRAFLSISICGEVEKL